MTRPIITLTSDFGEGSPYVAQMKGAILQINPAAQIVDVTHSIEPQNIRQGALVLGEVAPQFPCDAIHVAVVDPGVGGGRRIVYASFGGRRIVAPDNGLLTVLARDVEDFTIIELVDGRYWRERPAATFHGRDIMAPVAAHLSLGLDPAQLGPQRRQFVQLPWPEAKVLVGKIEGEIVSVDSFGNLITNITSEMLKDVPTDESVTVRCDDHETLGIYRTYSDQPPMTLIALVGSSDKLELAIVDDSAKIMLGVRTGDAVTVSW